MREDHAAYIAAWLKVLSRDSRAIFITAAQALIPSFFGRHHAGKPRMYSTRVLPDGAPLSQLLHGTPGCNISGALHSSMNKLDSKLAGEAMREIGSFEAKNKLSALLDQVEHGTEIVITRHGKAVAKLVPAEPGFDRKKAKRAAAGLREASKGVMLRGLKIKDLINEGPP